MNTKFTKGPWKTGAEYGQIWNVYGADGTPVALASATSADLQQVERTANAALIASAPELYEALEQIAALYIDDRSSAMHKALCIANKALKKARGEA
jgi:hypothetical protein